MDANPFLKNLRFQIKPTEIVYRWTGLSINVVIVIVVVVVVVVAVVVYNVVTLPRNYSDGIRHS